MQSAYVCLASLFLFLPVVVYLQCFTESVFIFNPLIDTYLPKGFTQASFNKIQVGMTKAEVLELIPAKPNMKTETSWIYGCDGAAPWGDFAWIGFHVEFNHLGRVITTEQLTFHD
jgi:hypothetical protein